MLPEENIIKCPICYRMIFAAKKPSNCSHIFCNICLDIWKEQSNTCPICRTYFSRIIKMPNIKPWRYTNYYIK